MSDKDKHDHGHDHDHNYHKLSTEPKEDEETKNQILKGQDLDRAIYLVMKAKPLVREKYVIIWPVIRILCCCMFKKKDMGWR